MLKEAGYNQKEISYLVEGFSFSFNIGYQGPQNLKSESENIPLKVGNKTELWNQLMKEGQLKQVAGPYEYSQIPFENYIQSPIGLVPKAGNTGKTRLIFHLSYDFHHKSPEKSLNFYTPKDLCTVKYRDLDYAVRAYLKLRNMETK